MMILQLECYNFLLNIELQRYLYLYKLTFQQFYYLYMCNPVTPAINLFRYAYLGIGEIDWLFYAISWVVTILIVLVAVKVFAKVEKTFIDTV